jgi:cytochrome c peroxidase
MNRKQQILAAIVGLICLAASTSWTSSSVGTSAYPNTYTARLDGFREQTVALLSLIDQTDLATEQGKQTVRTAIRENRIALKSLDFWTRYLEPTAYKKLNGPLPVEWETEVFEKYEKPYRREGAGLTLAWLYLEEEAPGKDSLKALINAALNVTATYAVDSITRNLQSRDVFFLCNRLYLLNLAAIYTTGFECPDGEAVIPELRGMMQATSAIYTAYNQSFPTAPLSREYLSLYDQGLAFVKSQPADYTAFDHFSFIRDYVNPLFRMNSGMMREYEVSSRSLIDYALNKKATSIFDRDLYFAQSTKGIFHRVADPQALAEIDRLGKLLFYDPILSGNSQRACASCHKPTEYFTDTAIATAPHFNHTEALPRNTPSLISSPFNHLVMMDGKHLTLQEQNIGVITNAVEMSGTSAGEVLQRVMSCDEYRKGFKVLLQYTPQEAEVTMQHLVSAITLYYSKYGSHFAPFDNAITSKSSLDADAVRGFNLFMGKAQCGTCHFVPQFNGVKPPYIGSEFEVLGVPANKDFTAPSTDKGRWGINPAVETEHAFRTGTVRNAAHTAPYMHNGVFHTLEEVIDFYDAGGGAGRGLAVQNQTLSSDSLHLSKIEKGQLLAFIRSLNEAIPFEAAPTTLPRSRNKNLNNRVVGGVY